MFHRIQMRFFAARGLAASLTWLLLLALAASLAASVALLRGPVVVALPTALLYVATGAGLLAMAGRIVDDRGLRRFLVVLALCGLVLKSAIVLCAGAYAQTADRAYFHDVVAELCSGGLSPESTAHLSATCYDFRVWLSRALPLQLGVRHACGDADVAVTQVLNILFSTGLLWPVWILARRFLSCRGAARALALFWLIPIQHWHVLDYSYEIPATFFFLVGAACFLGIVDAPARSARAWILSLGLAGCLILAGFQGGLDVFLMGVAVACLVMRAVLGPAPASGWSRTVLLALALPLLALLPAKHAMGSLQDRLDTGHLNSGGLAFMARGWSLRSGGEYDARVEQMDRITPAADKSATMKRLILSTLQYHPVEVFARLLPTKAAKYFLVGFASGVEEGLEAGGEARARQVFRVMRLLFAPVFLFLCVAGCLRAFPGRAGPLLDPMPMLILLMFCGASVLVGETSPRYSFYVQPFMALLAAIGCGASSLANRGEEPDAVSAERPRHRIAMFLAWSGLLLALYMAAAAAAVFLPARLLHASRFVDLSSLSEYRRPPAHAEFVRVPGPPTPSRQTERRLAVADGTTMQSIVLPVGASARRLTLFVWPSESPRGATQDAVVVTRLDGRETGRYPVTQLVPARWLEMAIPTGSTSVTFAISIERSAAGLGESAVNWGCLAVDAP